MAVLDVSPFLLTIVTASIALFAYLIVSNRSKDGLPDDLPWVGRRNEVFSKTRAYIRAYTSGIADAEEGYSKYSKHGKSFVIPDATFRPQVMLPPEHNEWLIKQPENTLNHRDVQVDRFGIKYLFPVSDHRSNFAITSAIDRHLPRHLSRMQADLFDEIRQGVDELIGLDESWIEIRLYDTLQRIIFRAGSRLSVGLPLCRDEEYLHKIDAFSMRMAGGGVVLGQLVPWFLSSILGAIAKIPLYAYKVRIRGWLVPEFKQRIAKIVKDGSLLPKSETNTILDFTSNTAFGLHGANVDVVGIAERFAILSGNTTQTTSLAAVHAFMDLISSNPERHYVDQILDEIKSTFKTEKDWCDQSTLLKLTRLDSAIRESLRLSPVIMRQLMAKVMPKGGIDLPDGVHVPQGMWIGTLSAPGVHLDERFYENPKEYDPFRFSRTHTEASKEEGESEAEHLGPGKGLDENATSKVSAKQDQKTVMLSTTSESFLVWGYGRHACPGRHLASNMLKLIFAYILLHYDIERLDKRPENMLFGGNIVPPLGAKIKLRRKVKVMEDEEA